MSIRSHLFAVCLCFGCYSRRRPYSMKGKKLSVDFGTLGKAFMPDSPPRGPYDNSGQSSIVPSVIISRSVELLVWP